MADNVTLNAGSGGAVVATDDVGGIQYQRVKIAFGADGAAADTQASNPLPVLAAGRDLASAVQVLPVVPQGLVTLGLSEAILVGAVTGRVGQCAGRITTAATTRVAIRNSTFNEQTAGAQRSIKSSAAADASAGTGVRTVTIRYYTLSGGVVAGPFTETKTLNGTTAVVTTATNICYIEKMWAVTVGSGGVAAGNIDLFTDTAGVGTVMARIALGERNTQYAHHYVPTGGKTLITGVRYSNSITTGTEPLFDVVSRDPTVSTSAQIMLTEHLAAQGVATGSRHFVLDTPLYVAGPAIVEAFVVPNSVTSQISRFEFSFAEV